MKAQQGTERVIRRRLNPIYEVPELMQERARVMIAVNNVLPIGQHIINSELVRRYGLTQDQSQELTPVADRAFERSPLGRSRRLSFSLPLLPESNK